VRLCVSSGGSITGEHGVGVDKAAYMGEMFSDTDLETMNWLRCSFDPETRFNPGKIFPTPRLCGDRPGRYVVQVEAGVKPVATSASTSCTTDGCPPDKANPTGTALRRDAALPRLRRPLGVCRDKKDGLPRQRGPRRSTLARCSAAMTRVLPCTVRLCRGDNGTPCG